MSRRRSQRDGEVGFGSDSFLDIIANIVGILIILIVVAGVRVSNAPLLDLVTNESEPVVEESDTTPSVSAATEPGPLVGFGVAPTELPAEPDETPAPLRPRTIYVEAPAPEADPDLVARIDLLRGQLTSLEAATSADASRGRELQSSLVRTRAELAAAEKTLAEQTRQLGSTKDDVTRLATDLAQAEDLIIALREQAKDEKTRKPNVEDVGHELTPVSNIVQSKELHFRLAGNRIAPIPLDELLDRLKSQVERQRDWLVKFRAHQGVVGPIDGFRMQYVVQRQQLSTIDRLRGAQGIVRIGLSRWELEPTDELRPESYDEAIASGSRFRRAIGYASSDTTLTFWVYPDSFELFRKLQKVAHENDFVVAGRPLPDGVPIAGSPDGSKSSGQ